MIDEDPSGLIRNFLHFHQKLTVVHNWKQLEMSQWTSGDVNTAILAKGNPFTLVHCYVTLLRYAIVTAAPTLRLSNSISFLTKIKETFKQEKRNFVRTTIGNNSVETDHRSNSVQIVKKKHHSFVR